MKGYTFVDWATQGYLLLVAILVTGLHNGTVPGWPWLVAAHVVVVLLVHVLIRVQTRRASGGILTFLRYFYPILLYAGFYREIGWANRLVVRGYLDLPVIEWEQALFGCQPSLEFMARLPYLGVSEVFYAAYFSYYLMIGGVGLALYLGLGRRASAPDTPMNPAAKPGAIDRREQFFHYVSVVSFVFYVCYTIYLLVPVVGPVVFFHSFDGYTLPAPWRQLGRSYPYPEAVQSGPFYWIMKLIYRGFETPGAALPSSHVIVAWCTVYFSFRYLRRIRYLHALAATLLCFATVYCRYHYGLDVITGLVTAIVLVPAANWLYFRLQPNWRQSG